jgi:hypothetical protein
MTPLINNHFEMSHERVARKPERRNAVRTYPLNFCLTLLAGFMLGLMFWLPWLYTEAEVAANVEAFWIAVFGG